MSVNIEKCTICGEPVFAKDSESGEEEWMPNGYYCAEKDMYYCGKHVQHCTDGQGKCNACMDPEDVGYAEEEEDEDEDVDDEEEESDGELGDEDDDEPDGECTNEQAGETGTCPFGRDDCNGCEDFLPYDDEDGPTDEEWDDELGINMDQEEEEE